MRRVHVQCNAFLHAQFFLTLPLGECTYRPKALETPNPKTPTQAARLEVQSDAAKTTKENDNP